MVALTLMAMERLQDAGYEVPEFHVMTSDTLVENPAVLAYSKGEIRSLKDYAASKNLPVRIWVC
ncbi:hypothetical protein, partial [Salmonella enterica]